MNTLQLFKQLRHRLRAATWDTGASVFRPESVVISVMSVEEALDTGIGVPFALLRPLSAQNDPQHGQAFGLLEQRIGVTLVTAVAGGKGGEKAMIGGNWTAGERSPNTGILEVEEILYDRLKHIGQDEGVGIKVNAASAGLGGEVANHGFVAFREYEFAGSVATSREYPAVRNLSVTALTAAGGLSVSWANPEERFDFKRIEVRYLAGSTAPTTATGTEVSLAAANSTSISITGLSAATLYSVSVFVVYDDRHETPMLDREYSDAVSGSATTN